MTRARPVLLALLAIATVASLVAALWGVDAAEAVAALRGARWGAAPALLGAFALNHGLRALRWHVLLAAAPLARSLRVCWIGFLAISLLPLRLGEAVRPALHASDGVPVGRTVAALLTERLLDLCGLLALLLGVALWVELPTTVLVDGVDVVTAGQQAAAGAVAVGVVAVAVLAIAGDAVGRRLPVGGTFAIGLAAALRELAKAPLRAAAAALLTVAVWGSTVLYVRAALLCFPALPQTWDVAATTWAAIISGITVLPTPGFFGAYEASGVAALRLFGASATLAATGVLFLHLAYVGFVALVGLPALWLEGIGLRGLATAAPPGSAPR